MTVLYHYTDAYALRNIIQERELWLTESVFMNDPLEVSFGVKVLQELAIRDAQWLSHESDEESVDVREIHRILAGGIDPQTLIENRAFILSCSDSDRNLTLWRLYSGRAGFCLGLDGDLLVRWLRASADPDADLRDSLDVTLEREIADARAFNGPLSADVREVQYGEEAAANMLRGAILAANASPGRADQWVREAAYVKHSAFVDESESRLVVYQNSCHDRTECRVRSGGQLVTYLRVKFPFEALRSITLAPGADFVSTRHALNALMSNGGRGAWGHVEIRGVDLPYRW